MNWDADPQDQAIVQIMIALYVFMDGGIRPVTDEEIETTASEGNVSPGRVRLALREAIGAEMVERHDGDLGPAYSITAKGVRWMEDNFFVNRKPKLRFVAKRTRISLIDEKNIDTMVSSLDSHTQIDWTMWGAIFAGVGIVVSIVIAVII